ncbi:MAG TPA: clostripain-related cysteine peptidase [Candidatus Angelobacter sp.]|nr:clostripain-related cysteine peptidase [Candidatus Angelobacter sp.]
MVDQQNSSNPNWTIMVYIAADDMLSDFAVGSLQQLRRLASENPNIVVAAQFDANGKQNIPRLIFQGVADNRKLIRDNKIEDIDSRTDLADPSALREFVNWAYEQRKANHYCLVLWGHGPELLANDYPLLASGKKPKRFLTPCDIKNALASTKLRKDGCKFDIVAIDACSMSMMEVACELRDHAEFLVASQEDVPDFSFPYDKLLTFGDAKDRNDIASLCKELPARYIAAYEDYTFTKATQTASITLSSLSLKDAGNVTGPLGQLVSALLQAGRDRTKRRAIIDARANSKEFVVGLYVDLHDFCQRLSGELFSKNIVDESLVAACDKICDAIRFRAENAFVIASKVSEDERCHGVSIYFPYMNEPAKDPVNETAVRGEKSAGSNYGQYVQDRSGAGPLTRGDMAFTSRSGVQPPDQGGTTRSRGGLDLPTKNDFELLGKGGLDLPSKGGLDLPSKGLDVLSRLRRQRIEETEQYYPGLRLSSETDWDKFIRCHWSRWLVEDVETRMLKDPNTNLSEVLNQKYSAQQCALNLLSFCRELEQGGNSTSNRSSNEQAGVGDQPKQVPANGIATTR